MWNEAYRCHTESKRPVRLVRYEQLVRDPVSVLESICALLGEIFEPAMLGF